MDIKKTPEQIDRYIRKIDLIIRGQRALGTEVTSCTKAEWFVFQWLQGKVEDPPEIDDNSLVRLEENVVMVEKGLSNDF